MISLERFSKYPDSSRIWIYGFSNPLCEQDEQMVRSYMDPFTQTWKSHGRSIDGAYHILEHRFIIFAISEQDTISGCSIDSSVRILEKLRDEKSLDALNFNIFFIQKAGEIQAIERAQFMPAQIDAHTHIYDLSIQSLGELRRGSFLKLFKDSWAAKVFADQA